MTAPFRVRQAGARLAEPADDMNGRNGYMVLTGKGKATKERTDFERIRMRGYLREDMLHPLLQGRIYNYFAGDDLGTAVFEAFKTVEIEVRGAGNYPEKEIGKTLMFKAFASKGPLTRPQDDKADCEALAGLFAAICHPAMAGRRQRLAQDRGGSANPARCAARLPRPFPPAPEIRFAQPRERAPLAWNVDVVVRT